MVDSEQLEDFDVGRLVSHAIGLDLKGILYDFLVHEDFVNKMFDSTTWLWQTLKEIKFHNVLQHFEVRPHQPKLVFVRALYPGCSHFLVWTETATKISSPTGSGVNDFNFNFAVSLTDKLYSSIICWPVASPQIRYVFFRRLPVVLPLQDVLCFVRDLAIVHARLKQYCTCWVVSNRICG